MMKNILSSERGEIVFFAAFLLAVIGGSIYERSQNEKQVEDLKREMAEQKHYLKYHAADVDKENVLRDAYRGSKHYKIEK